MSDDAEQIVKQLARELVDSGEQPDIEAAVVFLQDRLTADEPPLRAIGFTVPIDHRLTYPGDRRGDTIHVPADHAVPGVGIQLPLVASSTACFVNFDGYPLCIIDVTYDQTADKTIVAFAIATSAVRDKLRPVERIDADGAYL